MIQVANFRPRLFIFWSKRPRLLNPLQSLPLSQFLQTASPQGHGLCPEHLQAPVPPCWAWHCKSPLQGYLLNWAELNPCAPHPTHPPLWLGSSISTSGRKRWLFSLLTTAMHLFGLNWHLQPMEGQMYEITEDTASSWPVPTDVSLYPSGGTGLEIPDRKGKGATEGRVAVLSVSWVLCVCLWTEEIFIMRLMCLTHSSMLWRSLHPSALHAGCQSTCVSISAPCHCELIAGLGQHSWHSAVSHLMPWGKHYGLSHCWGGWLWLCGIKTSSSGATWWEWTGISRRGCGEAGRWYVVIEIPSDPWGVMETPVEVF